MKVTPYNPPWVFLVQSESQSDQQYTVDLTELNGNGQCDCHDFQCRQWPEYRRGVRPARCKHILVARRYQAMRDLDEKIRKHNNEERERRKRSKNETGSVGSDLAVNPGGDGRGEASSDPF